MNARVPWSQQLLIIIIFTKTTNKITPYCCSAGDGVCADRLIAVAATTVIERNRVAKIILLSYFYEEEVVKPSEVSKSTQVYWWNAIKTHFLQLTCNLFFRVIYNTLYLHVLFILLIFFADKINDILFGFRGRYIVKGRWHYGKRI